MSKPTQLPFTLNESQIVAALAAALLGVDERKLSVSFTNSRPPKGLSAALSFDENFIREAVIGHARKLVNPAFTHFSVEFIPTRGEDGQTASIIASTHPIAVSDPEEATAAPTAEPASAKAEVTTVEPEAEAPWEDDGTATSQEATAETTVTAEAPSETATTAAAPAPAGRARLFADLNRQSIKDDNAAADTE